MELFGSDAFAAALSLIGIVIIVSALLSGLIERSGLSHVIVFLALGVALGPWGLGVVDVSLDSATLRIVATLSLTLVLFTDAVSLNISEVKNYAGLALRLLGPGTLLTAAVIALAAWRLLDLSFPAAAILGAALASTDPVLLRGLLRRRDIPDDACHALRLESGLNDIVLLPIVLIAMFFYGAQTGPDGGRLTRLGLDLFILGPGAGILVGLFGVASLDLVRKRLGVRRDYESLYSLGVALTAYGAAEAVHGSGFLAAFAAGMTIAALDVELCDCFLEYGEVTAEMLLLFTFVVLGSSLIWTGFTVVDYPTLAFAAIALLVRTPIYLLSLVGSGVKWRGRLLISWFGPRGLSSLLLILLPVFAGLPGSERLFAVCSLVVLISVALHGGAPMLLSGANRRMAGEPAKGHAEGPRAEARRGEAPEAREHAGADDSGSTPRRSEFGQPDGIGDEIVSVDDLRRLQESGEPVAILDVRSERSLAGSDKKARGAIRMPPDHVKERAEELGLEKDAWLIAYCA